jgi:hypothetical protein
MPYAHLDDRFYGNPKILGTPLPALGLYAVGLSYCNAQLTDGFIPRSVVVGWRGWAAAAKILVARNLWAEVTEGFHVHDFLDWNPSRQQVLADRAAAAERKRSSRGRPAGVTPESRRSPDTPDERRSPVSTPLHSGRPPAVPDPPYPPSATGADGAAPRAVAEPLPVTLRADAGQCPLCRLPFTGSYLDHTAEKHKVNSMASPGNLFGGRRGDPVEAPPPEVAAQFAAMHERLQSLPDEAQA